MSTGSVKTTLYAPALEATAPNITTLIDAVQTTGESWTDALLREIPFLQITPGQKAQLQSIIDAALTNQPPPTIADPSQSIRNLVLYGSLGLFLWKLLKA